VLVDNVAVAAVSPYTFTNVLKTYEISATFAAAVPAAPAATAATLRSGAGFTANWGAALNAANYSLDVSTSPVFATFVGIYNNLNVGNFVLPAVPSFAVTGLTPGTTYYYRVRANNGTAISASSNAVVTTTAAQTSIGDFRSSLSWYLDKNGNGVWNNGIDILTNFGFAGVTPVTGNWSGLNGTTKIGIYDPATFAWYLDFDGNGYWNPAIDKQYLFGFAGGIPVTGDWNGDGTTKIGIYNPTTFTWYLDFDGNGIWNPAIDKQYVFGLAGVIPVTGDWNGDGKTKIGIYNPTTFAWYLDFDGNGIWNAAIDKQYAFGFTGVKPVTGDWNSNGITKIGVYDPAATVWYKDMNGNGIWDGLPTDAKATYGAVGSTPVTGNW
jgi:hypothetical protein